MSMNCPVLSLLFFTCTMRPVGVLNFGNSSSLWSKAKRSCSRSYPHALSASPTVGSTAVHACLTHRGCIHPDMMPCHTDVALVCSRSIVRDLLHQRYFPATRAERSKPGPKCSTLIGRVRSVSCHTSCESVVHCLSAPLPESGHQAYT